MAIVLEPAAPAGADPATALALDSLGLPVPSAEPFTPLPVRAMEGILALSGLITGLVWPGPPHRALLSAAVRMRRASHDARIGTFGLRPQGRSLCGPRRTLPMNHTERRQDAGTEGSIGMETTGMETTTFIRGMEVRALLEATAIVRLVDTLDALIAEAERNAATDAIAEHCAASWRRRRDALLTEHASLVSGAIVPA